MLIYCTLNEHNSIDFGYIYAKYKNTVYSIIYKYLQDTGLSEDTMQEAFLRFFNTMGKMQTEDDMRRWLFKIAKNAALNCTDKDNRYRHNIGIWLDDDDLAAEFLDKTAENPLNEVLKMELAEEITEILGKLKPIHSNVIRLKYYFGYTTEEIAQMTKVPVHTVYSRLDKARSLLLNELSFVKDNYIQLIVGVFGEKK